MSKKGTPPIPLQRYLQNCGLGSRRDLRQRIHDGRFRINGEVVTNPAQPVQPGSDEVREGQRPLHYRPQALVYYAFNKPTGVITSLKDPQGRPCVGDFLRRLPERVYPVGRLDWDSEGLLLLTNDGDLTQRILAARNHVPKTYLAKIKGILDEETRARVLEKGLVVDGRRTRILQLDPQKTTHKQNTWILITVMEGRNHLVRHIFQYLGHPVDRLRRVAVANFQLGKLPLGHLRMIRPDEIRTFWAEYPEEGAVEPSVAPWRPQPSPSRRPVGRPVRSRAGGSERRRREDGMIGTPSHRSEPEDRLPERPTEGRAPRRSGTGTPRRFNTDTAREPSSGKPFRGSSGRSASRQGQEREGKNTPYRAEGGERRRERFGDERPTRNGQNASRRSESEGMREPASGRSVRSTSGRFSPRQGEEREGKNTPYRTEGGERRRERFGNDRPTRGKSPGHGNANTSLRKRNGADKKRRQR